VLLKHPKAKIILGIKNNAGLAPEDFLKFPEYSSMHSMLTAAIERNTNV
jgi:hypothetical protein